MKKHFRIITFIFIIFNTLPAIAMPDPTAIDSINALGRDYIYSNVNHCISVFRQNMEDAKAIDYPAGEAKAAQNLGVALYMKGEYDESVAAYLQAIRIYESLNLLEDLAYAYGDLGYQMKRRDLPKGKSFMQQAIRIAEAHAFNQALCALYDNYGVIQEMSSEIDSSQYFYQKSLTLKTELKDTVGIPFSLNNLAGIYTTKGDFAKAEELLKRSDEYRSRETGNYGRIVNMLLWGDLFLKKGALDSAIYRYQTAIGMPGAFEQGYLVSYCYNQLATLYEQKKDYYNAYVNQKNFAAHNDSLLNIQTNSRIAELEIEFEAEKKDRLIAENQLKIKDRNELLGILGIAILVLLFASFGIWKYQHLKKEQLRSEMALKNQLKQAEYEQKISDEKLRISRDLHDNIGSQLTLLISSTDNLAYIKDEAVVQNKLAELSDFGRSTLDDLRNTVWAMKHEDGNIDTLMLKLNDIKRRLSGGDYALEITNAIDGELRLSSAQMLNLYRIAQEGLQNAIKHSGATAIQLKFSKNNGELQMRISDNGRGFTATNGSIGSGLQNMQHRCVEIGGSFAIQSGDAGTEIRCAIPV
ncbi:MAG: sensor histidine kinase [Calditrichae bacterium]|nr:sensor histidine kinase [Calditrichia bacterium]